MLPKERLSSNAAQGDSESDSGFYVLLMRLNHPPSRIKVGAIGRIAFHPGFYAYCGSARRNRSERVVRHLARRKKQRWHIDYFTSHRRVRVESVKLFPLDGWTECRLNTLVQRLPHAEPIRGFGSSDCTCASHLTFFGPNRPDLRFEKNGTDGIV